MQQNNKAQNSQTQRRPIRIEQGKDYPQSALITWVLTNRCPYSCRYCPEILHNGSKELFSEETVLNFLNFLFDHYQNKLERHLHFSFSGGEPTASSHFDLLLDQIVARGGTLGMSSNGTRPNSFWAANAKHFSYIAFSFHPYSLDTNEQQEKFIRNVQTASQSTKTSVVVMMDPLKWDTCIEFIERARNEIDTDVYLVRLRQDFGNSKRFYFDLKYTEEQLAYIRDYMPLFKNTYKQTLHPGVNSNVFYDDGSHIINSSFHDLINNKLVDFKNWECFVGIESLFIGFDGRVALGNCIVDGYIGTIEDTNLELPNNPRLCPGIPCNCAADVAITKYKL